MASFGMLTFIMILNTLDFGPAPLQLSVDFTNEDIFVEVVASKNVDGELASIPTACKNRCYTRTGVEHNHLEVLRLIRAIPTEDLALAEPCVPTVHPP